MLNPYRLVVCLGIGVSLFSCGKENVSPESEESQEIEHIYELIDLKYALLEGDGIDTVTVKLPGFELYNAGNVIAEQNVKLNYEELVNKSLFVMDSPDVFPEGLVLDTFKVHVPSNWYSEDGYTLSSSAVPLTAEEQEVPYIASGEDMLTVRIAPESRVVITAAIDAYTLKCSFSAVFRDRTTGIP